MSRAARRESLLIDNVEQLRSLPRPGRPIRLAGWPTESSAELERRLTKWAIACGCETGAAGMLLAGALAIAWAVSDVVGGGIARLGLGHAVAAVGALLVGALLGKGLGLGWAAIQWRLTVRDATSAAARYRLAG